MHQLLMRYAKTIADFGTNMLDFCAMRWKCKELATDNAERAEPNHRDEHLRRWEITASELSG